MINGLKYGLINSVIGLIVGIFHLQFNYQNGFLLIYFAPIAIFITGFVFWQTTSIKRKINGEDAISLGVKVGGLSHVVCFILINNYLNLEGLITNLNYSTFIDLHLNQFTTIPIAFFLSFVSLFLYGWFTIGTSIIISIVTIHYLNKKE